MITHKIKAQKGCLPPKVEVLQMLVSMNLSRSHNLQRLKKKFKLENIVKPQH